MRRSFGSILMSTSSASGNTATVTAEVCTRPCCSVWGTRCTRCTPLSFFIRQHRLAFSDTFFQVFVLAILLDDRCNLAVRLGSLLVFRRVTNDLRGSKGVRQLLVAGFDLVESFKHGMLVIRCSDYQPFI